MTKRICSVEGCDKFVTKKEWCESHYRRNLKYGSPTFYPEYKNPNKKTGLPLEFIQGTLEKDIDECIFWPYAHNGSGYGVLYIDSKRWYASRYVCTLKHGEEPYLNGEKVEVRHLCGNGNLGCVNWKHLKWGTAKQNQSDRFDHGTACLGELSPVSKLSEKEVRSIYKKAHSGENQYKIAEEFNISQANVSFIKNRKKWSWLKNIEDNKL